jgi:SSS family solute:Na+ symporter
MMVVASLIASTLSGIDQVFQFIQEYTGLVSPGITAMFILGIFWKKTSARAAWVAVLITLPVPLLLKWIFPALPFLDNMAISFLIISAQMIIMSLSGKNNEQTAKWELPSDIYSNTDNLFKLLSIGILFIISVLYIIFW